MRCWTTPPSRPCCAEMLRLRGPRLSLRLCSGEAADVSRGGHLAAVCGKVHYWINSRKILTDIVSGAVARTATSRRRRATPAARASVQRSEGHGGRRLREPAASAAAVERYGGCLLYTSDAADDLPCVDLGGRRII